MIKTFTIILAFGLFLAPITVQGDTVTSDTEEVSLPEPGTLPDSPWYVFKSLSERIGTFFTFGDVAKAERYLELAELRLAEAQALAEKGQSDTAGEAVEQHQANIEKALARANNAKERGSDADEVLEKVSEATLKHQSVLTDVYERVPEQAQPAIERAMEAGMRGYEEALNTINGEREKTLREQYRQQQQKAEQRLEQLRGEGVPVPATPELDMLNSPVDADELPVIEEPTISIPDTQGGSQNPRR